MRRNKFLMKCDILYALKEKPLISTHILYRTGINHNTIKTQLETLTSLGLVKTIPAPRKPHQKSLSTNYKRNFYVLTQKGIDTIKALEQIKFLFSEHPNVASHLSPFSSTPEVLPK